MSLAGMSVFNSDFLLINNPNPFKYNMLLFSNSNAHEIIKRRLIGQRQKFGTAYSVIYCRKPDVMSNIACDWST